jgi:hypothetical protein
MNAVVHDVPPGQYPAVIREMLRHEDAVTNHRIMWLLVGQGFIASAFSSAKVVGADAYLALEVAGLLVALSAFAMLYRSYIARNYLRLIGGYAKEGTLKEEHLPLVGSPRKRIMGWRRNYWISPWFRRPADLIEPWVLMPLLFTSMWVTGLLKVWSGLRTPIALTLGIPLAGAVITMIVVGITWAQREEEN